MYYLNTANAAEETARCMGRRIFVDKTELIGKVWSYAREVNHYIAITRPRRFGKTMAANMLAAFLGKGHDTRSLFSDKKVAACSAVMREQNRHNVIQIDFLAELGESSSFDSFLGMITGRLLEDLCAAFPSLRVTKTDTLTSLLSRTEEKFVFILDEWDAVFANPSFTDEECERYVRFLQGLFKNKSYVEMAFMTGVLPIAKYSSGSPLNMFHEFSFMTDRIFDHFYGFDEEEILNQIISAGFSQPKIEELREWYDGYLRMSDNAHIYNPNSVYRAFTSGHCANYWEETGPMNEIAGLISANVADLREDIFRMTAGESLEVSLKGFSSEDRSVHTRDEILSAMVVYGFLSYDGISLRIPNRELMTKFRQTLDEDVMGIHYSLEESGKLLEATLQKKPREVARRLEEIHDREMSFITYSDENSLACVVLFAYYAARNKYDIFREERAGKGYVDFLFRPRMADNVPIILELKYNRSAKAAIQQIRDRKYILRMKNADRVLFVGINYSARTKKHTCLIEETSYAKELAAEQQAENRSPCNS